MGRTIARTAPRIRRLRSDELGLDQPGADSSAHTEIKEFPG